MRKKLICLLLVLVFAASAFAATEDVSVTTLADGTIVLVQPIDGGNIVELLVVRDGKLMLVDSYRYTRKSEIGGEYSIEFQQVKRIEKK